MSQRDDGGDPGRPGGQQSPAETGELKAIERTGGHDAPAPSAFTREAMIDADPALDATAEAADLLPAAELAALMQDAEVDGERTAAVEVPGNLLSTIPDPEEFPLEEEPTIAEAIPVRSIPTKPLPVPKVVRRPGSRKPRPPASRAPPPTQPGARRARGETQPARRPDPPASAPPLPLPGAMESEPPPIRRAPVAPPPEPARPAVKPSPLPSSDQWPVAERPDRSVDEPSVVLDAPNLDEEEATRVFEKATAEPRVQLPRGRLVMIKGDTPDKTWYVNRPMTQIGRGNDNDIVLLDIAVSRHHLRLDRHGQGFRVVDLDSGNGTLLNGRRVTREEVYDGDRIELGGQILEFTTVGAARERPKTPNRATDPNMQIRPVTPTAPRAVPRSWMIVWSVATFLAVFSAMYVTRSIKQGRQAEEQQRREKVARSALEQARVAVERRDWPQAREALEEARRIHPELADYARELGRINAEDGAQRSLKIAGMHLDANELAQARAALAQIAPDSVYAVESNTMLTTVRQKERAALVRQSEKARDEGREAQARALARQVLAEAPDDVRALAVIAGLDAAAKPPPAPVSAAPAPPPAADDGAARESLARGMSLYRADRLADASTWFDRAARQARSSGVRRQATARARAADTLVKARRRAESAAAGGQRAEAMRRYEAAMAADTVLGGHYRGRLRKATARVAVYLALQAFARGRLDEAARLNGKALGYDPGLSQAKDLARKIESRARP